jgi:hypothetical protein
MSTGTTEKKSSRRHFPDWDSVKSKILTWTVSRQDDVFAPIGGEGFAGAGFNDDRTDGEVVEVGEGRSVVAVRRPVLNKQTR